MPERLSKIDLRQLLAALNVMESGLAIYEGDHGLIFVNRSARRKWPVFYDLLGKGAARRDAIVAQIRATYPDAPSEKVDEWASLIFDATFSGKLFEMETADGKVMQTVHHPVDDDMFLAMSVDVTALRAREKELRFAKRRVERESAAKSEFLSRLSHELRTPLNGVLGVAALLNETDLDDRQRLYVETILESGDGLLRLLNEVLDLSRIDQGGMALAKTPFSPVAVAKSVATLMEPLALRQGLAMSVEADGETHELVSGDPDRFRQILLNLVGNAIKFTCEGGVKIRVVMKGAGDGGVGVAVHVEDTGVGMSPTDMERAFDRFYQASGDAAADGAGLGLTISLAIAEAMGGTIDAASEPGRGTRMTLRLSLPAGDNAQEFREAG